MPRYNVQNPDGDWACWSSIVDDFITDFMPRKEYDNWREMQYGKNCDTIEQSNRMEYEECLRIITERGYDKQ